MTFASATAHRALLARQRNQRIDALCEIVAEGATVKAAAQNIGVSEQTATGMMAQVRRELGWQAA